MLEGYTLKNLEERIGYRFQNIALLKQALTHSSFTNEQRINKAGDYERLEFLGDAVLELVSSDFLFREHPELTEGEQASCFHGMRAFSGVLRKGSGAGKIHAPGEGRGKYRGKRAGQYYL